MTRVLIAIAVIVGLVGLSYVLTNWLDRRRARGLPSIIAERTDDARTILAKRRAERQRQLRHRDDHRPTHRSFLDSHDWD